jgi:hypothetical protein
MLRKVCILFYKISINLFIQWNQIYLFNEINYYTQTLINLAYKITKFMIEILYLSLSNNDY